MLFAISIFNSCSKFEEGPGLSLKSKKARLANSWEIETIYDANGNEVTTADFLNKLFNDTINFYGMVPTMKFTFEKDETLAVSIAVNVFSFDIPGTWAFVGETGLKTTVTAYEAMNIPGSEDEYNILRLTSKELWLEYTNPLSSEKYEIHLISAE